MNPSDSESAEIPDSSPDTNVSGEETHAMPAIVGDGEGNGPNTETVLGDFRLLRRLGKGGMAEVWLAEQESLKRNVALKLLRPDLTEDATYVARFQTEAKAAAGLNHPNIVQVYTVGERNGQYYIAQEYVQGQTLKSFIQKKGPLEVNLALMIMRQVASALQSAGERGIVHRDIKPENIMLNRKGEAKVADFGLAQLQGGERLNLTQEGITMGTPLYMSPEQVSGKKLDHRSDIYSFGITCYHMLAGRPPFEGENAVSVAVKHLHESPEPLEFLRPDLPVSLCQVIARMTAKEPEHRYESAQSVLNDVRKIAKSLRTGEPVEHLLESSPATSSSAQIVRRPILVLSLLALSVLLGSAGTSVLLRQPLPPRDPDVLETQDLGSAREQYKFAMFEIDSEDAFRAVIKYYPTDKVWTPRAHEQLALMYMRDLTRHDEAKRQLEILSREFATPEHKAKARIGEAYLYAMSGQLPLAKAILESHSGDFQQYLTGSWKQREEDIRELIQKPVTSSS